MLARVYRDGDLGQAHPLARGGALRLKERLPLSRITAALLIVAGMAAIRLA